MQAKLLIDYTGIKPNSPVIPAGTIVNVISIENANESDEYYFVETLDHTMTMDVDPNEIEILQHGAQ